MAPNNSTQHAPSPFPPRQSSLDNNHHHSGSAAAEEEANEGYRGSGYSHGVVASHFLARGSEAESWMDFLADQSGNASSGSDSRSVPQVNPQRRPSQHDFLPTRPSHRDSRPHIDRTDSSSSRSSDRKRRLTTADVPMRRPSSIRMHSTTPGASNSDPILLDSSPATSRALPPLPPPPPPPPRDPQPTPTRRISDIVLPTWQPDADVSQCPVCGRTFTFLYRKHHCRKCGRVVCATCSPHRITIPRQYIVHPPSDSSSNIIDLTGDDEDETANMATFGPFRNPALGGGEEVRVCNPCVPDPNYGPPPQYTPSLPSRYTSQSSFSRPHFPPGQPPHPRAHRSVSSVHDASRPSAYAQTPRPSDTSHDSRRASHHSSSTHFDRWLPPLPSGTQLARPSEHPSLTSRYTTPHNFPGTHAHSHTIANIFPRAAAPPPIPTAIPTRRQIAEEDECPICGNELPPAPAADDAARTQHIEECIALHSGSPAPQPMTTASLPNQRTRGMSNVGGESSRMAHAARGMFAFIATEKDCVDAEGEEEECVICFEEYEAGDRMARLVCWCKFHEKCIKEWWDKKGRGACPTHQLHE